MPFLDQLNRHIEAFLPYSSTKITIKSSYFKRNEQPVSGFIQEIQETATILEQSSPEHAEIYAKKLLEQFDALKMAVAHMPKQKPVFKSSVSLSPNIHRLPPEKRLGEYRKALRALNEKISWLTEQQLQTQLANEQRNLAEQIAETEYRKQKCLAAIEELEEKLKFR